MVKVLNIIFGIGIAVVVFILILLGIQAFYPEPKFEDYCNQSMETFYSSTGYESCTDNMTMGECRIAMKSDGNRDQKCVEDFNTANKSYNKNFFIIASIFGVILILIAFFLMNSFTNISAGVACSGIVLIVWAFIRGWSSTDDKLKFAVGLVIAVIVIALTVVVNKKLSKD
jgi:VIT1/CCC1 family predicted Fe2+/Mn2+ transporter